MKVILKSAQGNTNSIGIRAMLDEEFYNVSVAFSRRIMQCGVIVRVYLSVKNEADSEIGAGTYR
jgi:hypothetical protein